MTGSTIIAEPDPTRLVQISDVDDLDDFVCLNLDRLITLDFATFLAGSGVKWAEGAPITDDPEGMVIFKISAAGLVFVIAHQSDFLAHLIAHQPDFDETLRADILKLAKFVKAHGTSNIYELATF